MSLFSFLSFDERSDRLGVRLMSTAAYFPPHSVHDFSFKAFKKF